MTKSFFASKTIWFGILQIVFGGVGLFTGWIDQGSAFTLIVTGFASLGLRIKTSSAVTV